MRITELAASRGTYILIMHLPVDSTLAIAKLGTFSFRAGHYLYVGSAMGPGGLRARLSRHARREKRLHWHIDFFLQAAELVEAWISVSDERSECRLARGVMALPGCRVPVPRFGASDCRCHSHLFEFPHRPSMNELARLVPGCALRSCPRSVLSGGGRTGG